MAISALRCDHLGKIVVIRGIVSRVSAQPGHIVLQECNNGDGFLPRSMDCFLQEDGLVQHGEFVEVTGKFWYRVAGNRHITRLVCIEQGTPRGITREEAQMNTVLRESSWFRPENFEGLEFGSAQEMIDYLTENAMKEGFTLTRKHSTNEPRITLRCHQHNFYGKRKELNEDCQFKVTIRRSSPSNTYHITSYHLTHSHFLDPAIYAHLTLPDEVKELIKTMHETHIQMPKIISVVKKRTGIPITSHQVRSLCSEKRRE